MTPRQRIPVDQFQSDPTDPEKMDRALAEYESMIRDLSPETYIDPNLADLCKRMSEFAREHKMVIITTPSLRSSEVALLFEKDGSFKRYKDFFQLNQERPDVFFELNTPEDFKPDQSTMMFYHKQRPRLPVDDLGRIRIPLEMSDKKVMMGFSGSRIGHAAALKRLRETLLSEPEPPRHRGGFAQPQMQTDTRSRSERRGHKPKKAMKGQGYLQLRKGY